MITNFVSKYQSLRHIYSTQIYIFKSRLSNIFKDLTQSLNVVVYGKSNVISPLGTKLHGSNHAY